MIFEIQCAVCGKHVRKRRSPANTLKPPRFCSQRCNGAARRGSGAGLQVNTRYDCAHCGREVETYRSPSALAQGQGRYCSLKCTGAAQRGERNPSFSGGRHVQNGGYVQILMPDHPDVDIRGYVLEHRLVMERHIGRRLKSTEVVHHINHRRDDNRIENLELMASQAEHARRHKEERECQR